MSSMAMVAVLATREFKAVVALGFEIEGFETFGEPTLAIHNGGFGFWEEAFSRACPQLDDWAQSSVNWSVEQGWALSHMAPVFEDSFELDFQGLEALARGWLDRARELFSPGWGDPVWTWVKAGARQELSDQGWMAQGAQGPAVDLLKALDEAAQLDQAAKPGEKRVGARL